jgi:glycosyltransferase involved in cell wall biosynthesis
VEEGENGYTFDPYDPEQLATQMSEIAHGRIDRDRFGTASANRIQDWTPDAFACGLRNAVQAAMNAGTPSRSFVDDLLIRGLIYR